MSINFYSLMLFLEFGDFEKARIKLTLLYLYVLSLQCYIGNSFF